MSRRPLEVMVVVRRPAAEGSEYLIMRRAADRGGYWNLVAGGVEWDESPGDAALRELREETGLVASLVDLELDLGYALADAAPSVLDRFEPGVARVELKAFLAEAPAGWEPQLNSEHDDARWCTSEEAASLLTYPEPRAAVCVAARREVAT